MPWKETCVVTERMRFVVRWSEEEGNFAELCREFAISRRTGYKWLERYEREGVRGLENHASVARSCPHRTALGVEDRLVLARKEHPSWGPRKIRAWLHDQDPVAEWPSLSTIGAIFKRRGLLRPRKRRLRVPITPLPRAEATAPNEVWSVDFKGHFALGNGTRCHPLTIGDVYSRYCLKCEGLDRPREAPVREEFERTFREFGLPARLRSDNGVPFASTAPGGLTALVVWWIKLGIVPERIAPGHPEQNGRHERFHRTLKEEATQPPGMDLAAQQRRFDEFRREYNEERPHESLDDRPPGRVYALSRRSYPTAVRSPEYEAIGLVRRVEDHGRISFRGTFIPLTSCLAGEPVGLREIDDDRWEVHYGPVILGVIDARGSVPHLRRAASMRVSEPGARDACLDDAAAASGIPEPVFGSDEPR
jgi:transposase InsO family protein